MQLQQLRYLIEIAETKSMNKAAQNLFISQPNLSNTIMGLEEELGIKIFNRTNRGVQLTKEGKDFLVHAKYIINQVDNIEHIYSDLSKGKSFVLEISSPKIFNFANVLSKIYNTIDSQNIKISLKETHKEKIIKDVANMDSEIGIIAISNIQERLWKNMLKINKLEFNEVLKGNIFIYLGEKNPLYNKEVIHPKELKGFGCVHLVEGTVSSLSYNLELDTLGISESDKVLYFNDKETIVEFIRNTDAYALGFGIEKRWEGIKSIPLLDNSIYFKVGWIKRKKEELSDEAKLFLDLVTEEVGARDSSYN